MTVADDLERILLTCVRLLMHVIERNNARRGYRALIRMISSFGLPSTKITVGIFRGSALELRV